MDQLEQYERELQDCESSIDSFNREIASLNLEITDLNIELDEKKQELSECESACYAFFENAEDLRRRIEDLKQYRQEVFDSSNSYD